MLTLAPAYYASVIQNTIHYRYYLDRASPHEQGLSGLMNSKLQPVRCEKNEALCSRDGPVRQPCGKRMWHKDVHAALARQAEDSRQISLMINL
jgi:hypothetical protein